MIPSEPLPGVAVAGGVLWWAVGSQALPAGAGTLVLAVGLLVGAGLYTASRRRVRGRAPAPVRAGLRRLALLGGILVLGAVLGLRALGWGELSVPVACALLGGCLVPAAELLGRRGCVALGAGLMLVGAVGAVLALRSAGDLYSTGLVGFAAGAQLWLAAAVGLGLMSERTDPGSIPASIPRPRSRSGTRSRSSQRLGAEGR